MEENYMSTNDYWDMYGNNTLHTNYNYFRKNVFFRRNLTKALPVTEEKIKNNIDALKAQEQRLYSTFGKDNYHEFMELIRQIMVGPDAEVISRFSNESLLKTVIQDITRDAEHHANVETATLTLHIDSQDAEEKMKAINKALDQFVDASDGKTKLSSKTSMSKGKNGLKLSFEANPQIMKVIVNRLNKTQFHPSKLNSDLLSEYLENHSLGDVTFTSNGKTLSKQELSTQIKYRPFPWGYRNSEIRKAWEDANAKQAIEEELDKAVLQIRDYILNVMGRDGSPRLQMALRNTLDDTLPYPFDPSDKNSYNIFFVGANYRNGLLGAFGEFGTALLMNYIYLLGGVLDTGRAKIIGQELNKQDVKFGGIGFQVKNYSIAESEAEAYTRAKIEVRQHPQQIAEYLEDGESFVGFVVNYYFNENVQSSIYGNTRQRIEEVSDYLQQHYLGELMRLAVNSIDKPVSDTVTFYSVGGKYLIPGSDLLQYYLQQKDYTEVEIKAPSPVIAAGEVHRWEDQYWLRETPEDMTTPWVPTSKNISLFNKMATNDISFTTTLKQNFNLKNYAINNGEIVR